MPKAEISWKRVTEEGEKLQVYVQHIGRDYHFFHRAKRFDVWQRVKNPPVEDWLALLDAAMASASPLFSGAVFIAAGVYQFSALKHACVTLCQRPFPFFFANWTTEPRAVFRLGLRQGLYCVGCCWAMMLVMFAVGVMNIVWMAALGIVMTLEKIGTGKRFTYAVGVALIVAGVGFVLTALAAHWPVHAI